MKKTLWTLALLTMCTGLIYAQDEEEEYKERGFKKQNIFTGGSLSLSFGSNTFLIGGNPVLGYKLADWIDGGLVVNYQYSSIRDYYVFDDRMRQHIYGGGIFMRLYPLNFLFGQAQVEHNFITLKYVPPDGSTPEKMTTSGNSVLVGAGYTQGRFPGVNNAFFYLSLLFDVSGNDNSPYTDAYGRSIPIIRGGVNVYPFR